jgi:hypothetical protein
VNEDQELVWDRVIPLAYDRFVEYMLRKDTLYQAFARTPNDWWDKQTRWFKVRLVVRTRLRDKWYYSRQRVAGWIFPEGRDW